MSPTQLWGLLGGCLVQCHIVALGLYPCSLDFVGSVTFPAMAVPEVSGRRTAAREQSTLRGNQARPNRYGAPDDDDHDDDDDDRGDRDARRRPRRRPGLGRKGLRGLQPFPPRPHARRDGGRALPPGGCLAWPGAPGLPLRVLLMAAGLPLRAWQPRRRGVGCCLGRGSSPAARRAADRSSASSGAGGGCSFRLGILASWHGGCVRLGGSACGPEPGPGEAFAAGP